MKLSAWLRERGRTQEWLAEQVGVNPATISRLAGGSDRKQTRKPSWELAARIRAATGGEVTELDWAEGTEPEQYSACPAVALGGR